MRTIVIEGSEKPLRCDLNVIEAICDHYGSLEAMPQKLKISDVKFLVAEMVNEHCVFCGLPERITPEKVGASLTMAEYADALSAVTGALMDCINVKKK